MCWGVEGPDIPALVPGLVGRSFSTMNTGGNSGYFPCFLDASGVAFCHAGSDSTQTRFAWSAMSVGLDYVCALTTGRHAYCWGDNDLGQLGNDSLPVSSDGHRFSVVPYTVGGGLTLISVSAGVHHTCGVATSHEAYCWGGGSSGELGDGGTTVRGVTPRKVAGGLSFRSVSAGNLSTCGLTTDSVAYCWGDGSSGNLGTGSLASALTPVPVAAP